LCEFDVDSIELCITRRKFIQVSRDSALEGYVTALNRICKSLTAESESLVGMTQLEFVNRVKELTGVIPERRQK